MKAIHTILAVAVIGSMTGCDVHKDFPDTAMKVGHILCSDGDILPVADCEALGKSPLGVVFHLNQDDTQDGTAYAVYLWDVAEVAFADSLGVKQNTSADATAYDGNTNTYNIYATTDTSSPMAESVFAICPYGQSAYVPSVAEMNLLFAVRALVNPLLLRCGGDVLPEDPDVCWYWTSTEVSGQSADKAWLYSLQSGAIHETPKDEAHKVRPVITLYHTRQ